MLLTAVFGGFIKPHELDPANKINLKHESGVTKSPPLPPDDTFLLGTDHRGYDMLSLLLNGMKYTLGFALAITLCRVLLALALGLLSGATGKGKAALATAQWVTSSVPPLLFLFPPLWGIYVGLGFHLGPVSQEHYLWFNTAFLSLATLIGVFPLAQQLGERTRFYNDKLFVTAAGLMGGSIWHRIRKHLLPSLRAEVGFAFLAEYVQVLLIMGQLAVLGIFIGGSERLLNEDGSTLSLPITGEWCSFLAFTNDTTYVRLYPWIILSVGAFYTLSILILQFFLNQMKKQIRSV